MTTSQFGRKPPLRRRSPHLAIVVLPDESTAFQAYRLLQYHGISPEHLAIVGEGYSSPERVGLMRPRQIAVRTARRLALRSTILGTVLCAAAALIWQQAGIHAGLVLLAGVVSGVIGAIVGALIGYLGEGNAASIYRHHLLQGRYLLMVEGPETLVRWGQEVLHHYSVPSPY
ncbi:hypothetical protein H6F43_04480 [Leptolyngbya sp. FACHB-36]|uniref:hypothetical protein n=1 Tax=Leptolyngbya sp. FACHB-36 TaxID=2692808 RepID=UPI001680A7B9|nr:hypothetical protein [Leptolyngbya sp. FACHB-36]MBD2019441.1 hypothetical protein [Leptolyngbya sp. FACHB-36]